VYQDVLVRRTQTEVTQIPTSAAAGVMTTRAASRAFFIAGTNRAQLRFTLMNHLCRDLEQVHDITRVPDRIRQDVSRSPGGDARAFLNGCIGCHSGMDPLAQAFAYYNFIYDADNDLTGENGYLEYRTAVDPETGTQVGWDTSLPGSGTGASSMGRELAHSQAFAQCQVKKVFEAVCLREPEDQSDRDQLVAMEAIFVAGNYAMKPVFADAADYCKGP